MGSIISSCIKGDCGCCGGDGFNFFRKKKEFFAFHRPSFLTPDDFRHNLIRRRNLKVFDIYEFVDMLGTGSIGSVSVVRKRPDKIGGSARTSKFQNKLMLPDSYHDSLSRSIHNQSNGFLSKHTSPTASERTINSNASDGSAGFKTMAHAQLSVVKKKDAIMAHHGNVCALKTINVELIDDEEVMDEMINEIEILRNLDHPNIVKALEVYEGKNEVCIILELCTGGDLYSRDPYTEKDAAKIVGKILSAVEYMHNSHIIHRDLKYENVLFESKHPNAEVKIIDFGLSKRYDPESPHQNEGVGTVYTMAPQVLDGVYDKQADMWSIGVITFMLLSSNLPFYGKKRRHVVKKILNCDYDFKGNRWKGVSRDAMEFIDKLLVVDPKKRLTSYRALNSKWQLEQFNLSSRRPNLSVMDNVQGALENYASYCMFKKLSLLVIAQKSTLADIGYLRDAFDQYNPSNNAEITKKEFRSALKTYNYADDELEIMFNAVDVDGSGFIHYTEFLAATLEAHGMVEEERLAEAFDRLDCDDSGYISTDNLRELLGASYTVEQLDELMAEADLYMDNQVSYEEFLMLFQDESDRREEILENIIERRMDAVEAHAE